MHKKKKHSMNAILPSKKEEFIEAKVVKKQKKILKKKK